MKMNSFLKTLAVRIHEDHLDHLHKICIVLPGKRAGIFLKKELSKLSNVPFFGPEVMSIRDFILSVSKLSAAKETELVFRLYKSFKKIDNDQAVTFDEFYSWANILLGDFNELDTYLVPPAQLFSYLNEDHALREWNVDGRPLTEIQLKYLRFWKNLGAVYKDFRKSLETDGLGYDGLITRIVAEHIEQYHSGFQKIIFAGFNALSKSEEKIIANLVKRGDAEIFWDCDKLYMEEPLHEAGKFLRKHFQNNELRPGKGQFKWVFEDLKTDQKEINIYAASGNLSQARVAGKILGSINSGDQKTTALILADESLLVPVLSSLPSDTQPNITMGYPLKHTIAADFIETIFKFFENINKFNTDGRKKIYCKDLKEILGHEFISSLNIKEFKSVPLFKKWLDDFVFIDHGSVRKYLEDHYSGKLFNIILDSIDHPNESFFQRFNRIMSLLLDSQKEGIEKEAMALIMEVLTELDHSLKNSGLAVKVNTMRSLFRQHISTLTLSFISNPDNKIQVMGLLETRTLDFDRIIILSVNEQVLPSGKTHNSMMPVDVKRQFGMPVYSEKDSVYAYHFYRVMQRASEIHLLYNGDSSGENKGERSRFIRQLAHELPSYNSRISIKEFIAVQEVSPPTVSEDSISVSKSDAIETEIMAQLEKNLSATALNTFRNCSLRFYLRYIVSLRSPDDKEESLDASDFGVIVHSMLEEIFKEFLNSKINPVQLKNALNNLERYSHKAFVSCIKKDFPKDGKDLLALRIAEKMVSNLLHAELGKGEQNNKKIVREVEARLEYILYIGNNKVNLFGKADRVDESDGIPEIIDYKTGKFNLAEILISIEELEQMSDKAFQLMFYAYLYHKMNPAVTNLKSSILSLLGGDPKPAYLSNNKNIIIDSQLLEKFEQYLIKIIESITNISEPFIQTNDFQYCKNCEFIEFCRRE